MRVEKGVYPSEDFSVVTSHDELCDLTSARGFLENPLDKNEWKQKTETGVISFDAQSLKSSLEKLTKHSILLVTGLQQVGKTTLLLCLVDGCLKKIKQNMSPWKAIVFLNPYLTPEELDDVRDDVESLLKSKFRDYAARQILFAADGLKRTGENDEEYARKCLALFEWILKGGYKLIASLRDDQKRTLEKILQDKERPRWNKCKKFYLDEEHVEPDDQFENVKNLLVNYLTWDRYKKNIKIPMSFDDPEFNEAVKLVARKSEGLRGYIVFLVDDISTSSHEFTLKTVERYPKGMTRLVWNTINRDYFVSGDKSLPLLLIFLAKQEYPVTENFVRSLTEWGVDELDTDTSINKKAITHKMGNLLTFHTEHSVSKVGRIGIPHYSLKNQIREAIENGLLILEDAPDLEEARKALLDVGDHFESLLTVTYLHELQEGLVRCTIPTKYYGTWFILADIARIWGVRNLSTGARAHALKYALDFYANNVQREVQRTEEWGFFENTLLQILRIAADAIPIEDCDQAIKFYRSINLYPNDSWSRWVVGRLHERKNEEAEALKWYVESKRVENTSRGYGSLIKKLKSMMENSPEDVWIEYLQLAKAAAIKAIECYAGEPRNWADLAGVLMTKAGIFYDRREYGNAIRSLDQTASAVQKAAEANKMFLPNSYEADRMQCQRRLAMILGRKARMEFLSGKLKEAIIDKKRAIEIKKASKKGIDTTRDEMWLSEYNRELPLQAIMTTLLKSILNLVELHAKDDGREIARLSDEWYDIKLILDSIGRIATGENLMDLKASALYHSLRLNGKNENAQQAVAEMRKNSSQEIDETQHTWKYHENLAESIDQQQVMRVLLEKIFTALIWTKDFYYHLRRRDIRNEEAQRNGLASKWSEIGWSISSNLLPMVPKELAARFFELSVSFRDDDAHSWYNLGWEYLQEKKTDPALKALTKSIQLEKDQGQKRYSHLSRIGIGKIHTEKGDFVLALKSFREATNLLSKLGEYDPREAVRLLIETAENLKDLASCSNEKNNRIEILKEISETYNRALEISQEAQLTDLPRILSRKIDWSRNWIQWSKEKAMSPLIPLNTILKTSLVDLLSLETDPMSIKTLYQKEFAFHRLKDYEGDIKYQDKILRIEPTNIMVYMDKSNNLRRLGRYPEALECINKALEINDKDASAAYFKGNILLKQSVGEKDETTKHSLIVKAIEWFDTTLRIDPNYAPAWASKGSALHDLGGTENNEKAAKHFARALELDPSKMEAWSDVAHMNFSRTMEKRKIEEQDFIAFSELVREALNNIDEWDKDEFVAQIRKSVIHCFKIAIFDDYITSKERLTQLVDEFKEFIEPIEAPSLDEIEKSCRRDKNFAQNVGKVKKIFGS